MDPLEIKKLLSAFVDPAQDINDSDMIKACIYEHQPMKARFFKRHTTNPTEGKNTPSGEWGKKRLRANP